jgi:hypothetical protein
MTNDEFKRRMARAEAYWPGWKPSEATLAVWFEDLERFTADELEAALNVLKRTEVEFAPSLGKVLGQLEVADEPPRPALATFLTQFQEHARKNFESEDVVEGRRSPTQCKGLYFVAEGLGGAPARIFVEAVGVDFLMSKYWSPSMGPEWHYLEQTWNACYAGEGEARARRAAGELHRLEPPFPEPGIAEGEPPQLEP